MEKEQFQKIMEALSNRLRACALQLDTIHTTDDLSRLTMAQAADLKSFCIAEGELMTKIVMVDLYHIIGMGKLTPPQMMKFTYTIQAYLQYRPTIKALAKHLDSIFDLPKIPVETQYKLQGLGDITLRTDCGDCEIDNAAVTDYTQLKAKDTKLPFRIEGHQIRVDMAQFDYFITLMSNIAKANVSIDNFKKKLETHSEYFGIEWTEYNAYEAVGTFKSADMFTRISGYYNKRI